MFDKAPGIPILDCIKVNEDKGSDEENPEDYIVEEILEEIGEEEDMDKYVREELLISDEYDSNDLDSNTEAESIISTPKIEIENYYDSIT